MNRLCDELLAAAALASNRPLVARGGFRWIYRPTYRSGRDGGNEHEAQDVTGDRRRGCALGE
jgi:hypothetical protein